MSETFGQKMGRWREAANISQSELARRMGVSRNYISNLERDFSPTAKGGKPQPSVETCDKIAHALGVRVAEVRIAAGYVPPGKPETWMSQKPDIDDRERERQAEAARMAEMVRGFGSLTPERQAQVLAIIQVLQSDHPQLLEIMTPPIEIIDDTDLTESDVIEIDTGNTPP